MWHGDMFIAVPHLFLPSYSGMSDRTPDLMTMKGRRHIQESWLKAYFWMWYLRCSLSHQ